MIAKIVWTENKSACLKSSNKLMDTDTFILKMTAKILWLFDVKSLIFLNKSEMKVLSRFFPGVDVVIKKRQNRQTGESQAAISAEERHSGEDNVVAVDLLSSNLSAATDFRLTCSFEVNLN